MRETIASGVLDVLEFGLLKGSGKNNTNRSSNDQMLGWGVEEKGLLLNMEVEVLRVWQGGTELEVKVRSLCYSRGVTADYLKSHERYNMKQCVFVLGDLGRGAAPWADLVQAAVFLHRKEFNIIWVDVPEWKSNPSLWLTYGAEIIRGLFRFLCIKKVSCVSCGIGGAVFLQVLAKAPHLFARTHLVYNLDLPKGKGVHLPIFEIEEALRKQELQLWFGFKDEEGVYDRFIDGTPQKAYDAVQKLQARLLGERQRTKRIATYDEVLITENLNKNPHHRHSESIQISIYPVLVFSKEFLESISFFLEVAPGTHQESMVGGLVTDKRGEATDKLLEGIENDNEPMSVRRVRIGHLHGLNDRKKKVRGNRKGLEILDRAVEALEVLPNLQPYPGLQDDTIARAAQRLGDRSPDSQASSRSGSRVGSRALMSGSNSRLASHSRTSTKDETHALPALLRSSSSTPNLPALANEPANSDSDDDGFFGGGDDPAGLEPWQHYRSQWQTMHKKMPGYTIPLKRA